MFISSPERPRAVLLLGHGAGGGVDAPDLEALTRLSRDRTAVLRFEQPWRTAGKRVAPAPARLDLGWQAARAYVREQFADLPLFLGGRSAGARVACRSVVADAPDEVAGVIALSFPLHPPGRPESSRAAELLGPGCPVLVIQGERDPFGTPTEIATTVADAPHHSMVAVPGCAHEFKPAKRGPLDPDGVADLLVTSVREFLDDLLRGRE
ncbi:alpha/beta hydrolase family protein [Granulicoccus sp. GXG6511]|uniref:alpha/beta hydrolase family protein n=1 Tax=Granulicoccus sp. GXG6511 TaxID=3381351 RepID=UPI003D7C7986